jgi:hypothetical protein
VTPHYPGITLIETSLDDADTRHPAPGTPASPG